MEKYTLRSKDGAYAEILTQGAHLCHWRTAQGKTPIFLSSRSEMREAAAVRGGVPVIFPQFSDHGPLPKHGFARTALWRFCEMRETPEGLAQARFELRESLATLRIWPHVFRAEILFSIVGEYLQMDLTVDNAGDGALQFCCALHTYLQVEEIAQTTIEGLAGLSYRDTVLGFTAVQAVEALKIETEIDRIYAAITDPILVQCGGQKLQVSQSGFSDAVIWNPGAEKAAQMADMEAQGEKRMLCVEAAAINQAIVLAPGATWTGTQKLFA